ncbi:hypothetical protein EDC01DRAFT_786710, partial [Geopyxis carbonaria]
HTPHHTFSPIQQTNTTQEPETPYTSHSKRYHEVPHSHHSARRCSRCRCLSRPRVRQEGRQEDRILWRRVCSIDEHLFKFCSANQHGERGSWCGLRRRSRRCGCGVVVSVGRCAGVVFFYFSLLCSYELFIYGIPTLFSSYDICVCSGKDVDIGGGGWNKTWKI